MRPLHKDDPRQIGGHRLVAVLGEGATAQVFLGATPEGRPIVLKAVRPVPARDPAFRMRFAHDVAAAERVACPYTVPVLDACSDGPVLWLATAYTPGPGLGEAVAKYGPLPARTVRTLAAGLAAALEELHGAGLVHGRLGPTQVSLAPDGPRVVDLGVARSPDGPSVTEAGVVVGTVLPSPGFRAPEQLDGRPVGAAADVFSLGCVIVHAATGTGPFGADTSPGVTERVLYGIPELRVLPSWLRELAAACLAKAPEDRPTPAQVHAATASELDGPGWLPHGIAAEVAQRAATVWAHSGAATPGTGPTMVPRTPPGPPAQREHPAAAPPPQMTRSTAQSMTQPNAQSAGASRTPVAATPVATTAPPPGMPPTGPAQPAVPPGARPFRDANRDLPPAPEPRMIGGPGAALHAPTATPAAAEVAPPTATPATAADPAAADAPDTSAPAEVAASSSAGEPAEPPRRFPMPIPRGPGASTRIGPSRARRTTPQQPASGGEAAPDAVVVGGPGLGTFNAAQGAAATEAPQPAATNATAPSRPAPVAPASGTPRSDAHSGQNGASGNHASERDTANQPPVNGVSGPHREEASSTAAVPGQSVGGPGAGRFTRPGAPTPPTASDAASDAPKPRPDEGAAQSSAPAVAAPRTAESAASPVPASAPDSAPEPEPAPQPESVARPEPVGPVGPVITVETGLLADEIIEAEIVEAELVDDDEPLPPRASVSAPPGVTDLPGKPAGTVRRSRTGQHDGRRTGPRDGQRDGQRGEPHEVPREGPRGTRRPSTGHPGRPGDDRDRTHGRGGRKDDRSRERTHDRPAGPNGQPGPNGSRPQPAGAPRPDSASEKATSPTATAPANSEASQRRSEANAERRRFLAWVAGGASVLAGAATGAVLWGDSGGKKPVRTEPVAAPPAPAAPPPQAAPLRVWFRQGSVTTGQVQELSEALRGADGRLRLAAELKEPAGYAQALVSELGNAADTAPDVFEVDILSLAAHHAAGRIVDLTQSQDRFDTDAWLPAIQSAVNVDERLLGLPLTASAPAVLFHQGMFAEAGVAVPSTRAQWVDGLEQLRTHFAADATFRPLWLPGRSWHVLASLIWGSGGMLAVQDGNAWLGNFNLPESIDGVRFFRRLQQYAPEAQDLTEDGLNVGELFARGRAASVVGSASLHPAALAADPGLAQQLNAFAMPGRNASAPGSVGVQGTALVVSSKCRDVPAAVELLALLATDPWRDQVTRTAGALSPRTVPEQAVFGPNPMLRAGAAAARTSGHAYPTAPGWSERPVLEFGRAVLAGTDAAAAAASANQLVAAEFGRTTG